MAPLLDKTIVATWSDVGMVNIWDATKSVIMLDAPSTGRKDAIASRNSAKQKQTPLCTFAGHRVSICDNHGILFC